MSYLNYDDAFSLRNKIMDSDPLRLAACVEVATIHNEPHFVVHCYNVSVTGRWSLSHIIFAK